MESFQEPDYHFARYDAWAYAVAMDSIAAGADLHGGHFEPAICVDAVHTAFHELPARQSCGNPDHVFAAHRGADVSLAVSGLPRG